MFHYAKLLIFNHFASMRMYLSDLSPLLMLRWSSLRDEAL